MRKLLLYVLLVAALLLQYSLNPKLFSPISSRASAWSQSIFYKKLLRVSGLSLLSHEDLRLSDFEARSVVWWKLNSSEVEENLLTNPLIAEAKVRPCANFSWNCFQLEIKERTPEFLANLSDRIWLVGNDGGLISPIPGEADFNSKLKTLIASKKVKSLNDSTMVQGLHASGIPPEVVSRRLEYAREALRLMGDSIQLQIKTLELNEDGELQVIFKELPLKAIFGLAGADSKRLEKEITRFKRVLSEFKGREDSLQKVDLAYESFAVVTLQPLASDI